MTASFDTVMSSSPLLLTDMERTGLQQANTVLLAISSTSRSLCACRFQNMPPHGQRCDQQQAKNVMPASPAGRIYCVISSAYSKPCACSSQGHLISSTLGRNGHACISSRQERLVPHGPHFPSELCSAQQARLPVTAMLKPLHEQRRAGWQACVRPTFCEALAAFPAAPSVLYCRPAQIHPQTQHTPLSGF